MTYVIGDVHGAGLELKALLDIISIKSNDKIILVGDCFDRGKHGHIVWELIHKYNIVTILGNHELKMLKFLNGKRDNIPPHYIWCLNNLYNYIDLNDYYDLLNDMPMHMVIGNHIIVHAGVNPCDPLVSDIGWNVYGNPPDRKGKVDWFDVYDGDFVVVYGHSVCDRPRVRRNGRDVINSVGLDTAVVHGGYITGFCLESGVFFKYRSGVDWFGGLKDEFRVVKPVLRDEVVGWRDKLKI